MYGHICKRINKLNVHIDNSKTDDDDDPYHSCRNKLNVHIDNSKTDDDDDPYHSCR